jgi:4-hydroxy-tetrahydrodipicolinate synthase
MAAELMRGVFPILLTPFDERERVDEESLRSLVEFNVRAGVHGLGVALGSEVFKLTEDDREWVIRTVVDQVGGRVPVVVNTGGPATALAVHYSRAAEDAGADAVMLIPPSTVPEEILAYFQAVNDAVSVPIFIQDVNTAPVAGALARRIAESCERVRYDKVESGIPAVKVGEVADAAAGLFTVFGGSGGNYLIEELRRGSQGTMPFPSQPEDFVAVWDRFQAGDERGATELFYRRILPVNRIAAQGQAAYYHVHKEILRRRGIIRTAVVRGPAAPLDPRTNEELARLIGEMF